MLVANERGDSLRIPGEGLYRFAVQVAGESCAIPGWETDTGSFKVTCYTLLKILHHRREVQLELYRLSKDILLSTRAAEEKGPTPQDTQALLTFFYKWQRLLEPGAIKPASQTGDELLKAMEENMEVFEKFKDGIKIQG